MNRLVGLAEKFLYWIRLLRTFSSGNSRIKLLGFPSYRGGPNTKAQQLRGLTTGDTERFGVVFALSAVRAPLLLLKMLRNRGARVLVNQNGVYYPAWAGPGFEKRNQYLRCLNELGDHTFFQSEFAKESYERWVGPAPRSSSILHNGVDTKVFCPEERLLGVPATLLFFYDFKGTSRVYWDWLFAWLNSADFPLKPGTFRVLALGHCPPQEEHFLIELKRKWSAIPVEFFVNVSRAEIPALLRRADFLVHLIYNDVCPNKVLEAMASGVWPVCVSAGGTRELVGDAGVVLPVVAGYGEPILPSPQELSHALSSFLRDPLPLKKRARERAERFDIEIWKREVLKRLSLL